MVGVFPSLAAFDHGDGGDDADDDGRDFIFKWICLKADDEVMGCSSGEWRGVKDADDVFRRRLNISYGGLSFESTRMIVEDDDENDWYGWWGYGDGEMIML